MTHYFFKGVQLINKYNNKIAKIQYCTSVIQMYVFNAPFRGWFKGIKKKKIETSRENVSRRKKIVI